MRLPKITSLYGRIFAIFWFTMFLVLMAVLALPHLDPRKARNIPADQYDRFIEAKQEIEKQYRGETDLGRILFRMERDGNILTTLKQGDFQLKALKNFVTSIEQPDQPKQKLYGRFMLSGPLPVTLANKEYLLYVGMRWNQPPPFLLRMFDHPFQLLLAVMLGGATGRQRGICHGSLFRKRHLGVSPSRRQLQPHGRSGQSNDFRSATVAVGYFP